MSFAYRTHKELASPVVARARFCRRKDVSEPNSSHEFALDADVARLAKDPAMRPAADIAPYDFCERIMSISGHISQRVKELTTHNSCK